MYDNQLEGDLADEAPPTAAIGSGKVVVVQTAAGQSLTGGFAICDSGPVGRCALELQPKVSRHPAAQAGG